MADMRWNEPGGRLAGGPLKEPVVELERLALEIDGYTAKEARKRCALLRRQIRQHKVELVAVPQRRDDLEHWCWNALDAAREAMPQIPSAAAIAIGVTRSLSETEINRLASLPQPSRYDALRTLCVHAVMKACQCLLAEAREVSLGRTICALDHSIRKFDPQLKPRTARTAGPGNFDSITAGPGIEQPSPLVGAITAGPGIADGPQVVGATSEDTPDDPHLSPLAAKLALSVLDQARNEIGAAIHAAQERANEPAVADRITITMATAKALHQALTHVAVRTHG